MRKTGIFMALISLALAACGGGGDDSSFASGGTGGTGGGTGGGGAGGTLTVQMGHGTGSSFVQGSIDISNASLSSGGSTSLTVSLVQSDGSLYTGSADITFSSLCVAAGTAETRVNGTSTPTVTTSSGLATITYVARGCSGADTVTASATVNSRSLSATGVVTVAAASVGSIAFISATPTNIALKGTGDSSRPESATVVFQVLDQAGGPVANSTVAFVLNTSVGGVSLTAASASSDSQGRVQTVVNAGTVATSVKVTATITATSISTQSSQLTITTGIPTANSFSLAVGCFNIEGWDLDGTTTSVTARLGDRFQNPVPDGTALTFTAEGGNIQSQCTTTTTATEGGLCGVNFRSSNPRPADGRVTILAKAIGEESFTDGNGNGAFDNGEAFADLAEPYRDDNESGTYQNGEDFFDFNNNGVRDAADLLFNGVLCNDTSGRCGVAATRSTGIGKGSLIILSGSNPVVNQTGGSANMPANSAQTLTYWIRDARGNVLPGGTTIAVTASGGGLGVTQPSSLTVPCSTIAAGIQSPGVTTFSFGITSSTTTGSGLVTLTVTMPTSKSASIFQTSVSVP